MAASTRMRGRITVHGRGFGFLNPLTPSADAVAAFITPPDLNRFLADDVVEADVTTAADGRRSAANLALVQRGRAQVTGSVVMRGGKSFLHPEADVANTDLPLDTAGTAVRPSDVVVADVLPTGLRLARVLPADADVPLERVIVRHGIRSRFPDSAQRETDTLLRAGHELRARRDLRAVPTVTVDAPTTRDIDDAVSVLPADPTGGLRLLVSIADASEWVREGTALDEEARARATSVYLAGRVLPMLPPALSEDHASLHPGMDRLALTAELRVDPDGNVTSVDVFESLIRSHARLNYEEVAAFLDHGEVSEAMAPIRDHLRWFRAADARLGVARGRRGGAVFARDEARLSVNPQTQEVVILGDDRAHSAHGMIERFMVAANEAVGRWLNDRGVPAPWRVHDPPESDAVVDLEAFMDHFGFGAGLGGRLTPGALAGIYAQVHGAPCEPAVRSVMLRTLGPARYDARPVGHFGLAAPLYLHFTSPLRRYADLVVHRTVKAYLRGQRDFSPLAQQLPALTEHINERA
ncbi:MAG: RNB domain-containing ribonuclease, partial [Deltaproteobacteria bacterium]|nr:RNB domain-containing ribonuclease [Deltaproteobacteria bacterium]